MAHVLQQESASNTNAEWFPKAVNRARKGKVEQHAFASMQGSKREGITTRNTEQRAKLYKFR